MADKVTQFAETNALLAALEWNRQRADEILSDMFPGELNTLRRACEALSNWCSIEISRKQIDHTKKVDGDG